MQPFGRSKTLLGLLAVAAALALASPGVKLVRAGGEATPSSSASSEPAECSADPVPGADAEVQAFLEQLRREQMAGVADGEEGPIVLNGRGYNYGPPPEIELDLIWAEALRARND